MATGDTNDFAARIRQLLPPRWFPPAPSAGQASASPILDAVLQGVGSMWAWLYSLIAYIALQTRIATATDVWLDITSNDYFGNNLARRANESDAAFSLRIRANMFPPLQTRAAITLALTNLTGRTPKIFEPANPSDSGGYGNGHLAYGAAGGYGNLSLPFQLFVTAYRQLTGGVPSVGGYCGQLSTPQYAPGGYGVGVLEYVTPAMAGTQTNDASIYQTVATVQAAGVTAWTNISN